MKFNEHIVSLPVELIFILIIWATSFFLTTTVLKVGQPWREALTSLNSHENVWEWSQDNTAVSASDVFLAAVCRSLFSPETSPWIITIILKTLTWNSAMEPRNKRKMLNNPCLFSVIMSELLYQLQHFPEQCTNCLQTKWRVITNQSLTTVITRLKKRDYIPPPETDSETKKICLSSFLKWE